MRTTEQILQDFDSPEGASVTLPLVDSKVQSVRERALVEVLLDMRELMVEIKTVLNESKSELVEIKQNTAP